jgi:4-diphosphocytidyl-2-C-methyl-D-erythritol kinase
MTVTRFAPAKVNLYLHVGRPQADGRHPLDSVAAFAANIGDVVTATEATELTLTLSGLYSEQLSAERDNLVLRAAHALADHFGAPARAALVLEKNLPVASGIGGGSADAAAALHALNELWGLDAPRQTLEMLGGRLGSDIPACVHSVPVRMFGTGEAVKAVAMEPLHAVLVNPGVAVSTAAVFRAFDAAGLGRGFDNAAAYDLDRAGLAFARNDLEAPAIALAPVIGEALMCLRERAPDALVRMSGSGATCFALVGDAAEAQALARAVVGGRPDWWVRAAVLS